MDEPQRLSRRALLGGFAGAAAVGLAACSSSGGSSGTTTTSTTRARPTPAGPGSLPNPGAAAGTDQLPLIRNIVIVMMENHSYDNVLGMQRGRGDGFALAGNGRPTATNPWPATSAVPPPGGDSVLQAFPMPNPCQPQGHPYNTWDAFWASYAGGKLDGFASSQSGPVSMGYLEPDVLPFTNSLAKTFPVCDRYFASVGAQTYPNRRFLMAGTSLGLLTDVFPAAAPPNGTVFQALDAHGISWKNYYSSLPSSLIWSYQASLPGFTSHLASNATFLSDAAAGMLPAVSMVDPNFETQSQEDPQDVQYGDQFLAQVVHAVMDSPQWPHTILVWCYDESGGYYDHVPPPAAVVPDGVPPDVPPGGTPGSFDRYGFRVPAGVVSPYARPDYVSHVVHDHTSVLKLIETKWNLPALTNRDAAADDLLDSVDLTRPPHFLHPPKLAAPADPAALAGCLSTGAGTIPPPGAVRPA
ncbi:MAG TPA: alkaline phosphatase family protein [Acidimicrobiales bacterium]|nr:alkaline phosphatase family protein [Acidimicrobiales bacterium]